MQPGFENPAVEVVNVAMETFPIREKTVSIVVGGVVGLVYCPVPMIRCGPTCAPLANIAWPAIPTSFANDAKNRPPFDGANDRSPPTDVSPSNAAVWVMPTLS